MPGDEPLIEHLHAAITLDDKHTDTVVTWLSNWFRPGCPGQMQLMELEHVLPEMSSALRTASSPVVDTQTHRSTAWHVPSGQWTLHGMLMGYSDLVFEHWESTGARLQVKLGENDAAYDRSALANAMAHHRYDVQAAFTFWPYRLLAAAGLPMIPRCNLAASTCFCAVSRTRMWRLPDSREHSLMDALDAMLDQEVAPA